jgi:hypothetical protein
MIGHRCPWDSFNLIVGARVPVSSIDGPFSLRRRESMLVPSVHLFEARHFYCEGTWPNWLNLKC